MTTDAYTQPATTGIEFVDVHKSFDGHAVLDGMNMRLPKGEISMILGPSGTGKSVCMKHIVGLMRPDHGDVLVHGMSIPRLSRPELLEARKRFGVLFQDGALFGSLTLFDNVAYPLRIHSDNTEDEIEHLVMARLAEVGLDAARHRLPSELSGGMRKRAGFARALVLEPEILLFDEPDSGLDPVRTALLCELIDEIHEQNGGTYVIVSHDILSARRIARHIAIMWHGRVVEDGPADEVLASDHLFVSQFMAGEAAGPLTME